MGKLKNREVKELAQPIQLITGRAGTKPRRSILPTQLHNHVAVLSAPRTSGNHQQNQNEGLYPSSQFLLLPPSHSFLKQAQKAFPSEPWPSLVPLSGMSFQIPTEPAPSIPFLTTPNKITTPSFSLQPWSVRHPILCFIHRYSYQHLRQPVFILVVVQCLLLRKYKLREGSVLAFFNDMTPEPGTYEG